MLKRSKNIKTFLALMLMTTCISHAVQAQNSPSNSVDAVITDLSMDLEGLPPQPSFVSSDDGVGGGEAQLTVDQVAVDLVPEPDVPLPAIATPVAEMDTYQEPVKKAIPHSGTYYDSSSIGGNALTNSGAPRMVDPRYEPGSSFVVVQKSAGAKTKSARIVAAQRALDLGRYSSALELYEQLYKDSPKNKRILMGLAVAQQQSGFTESAIATYEELIKIDSKNADALSNMLGLLKTQYPSVAFRRLQDLWSNNNSNANIAAELGLVSAQLGQPQESLRYLGIAASIEPNNPLHYYNMAVINDQAGQAKPAIELYQKALEVDVAYGGRNAVERDIIYDRLAHLRRL